MSAMLHDNKVTQGNLIAAAIAALLLGILPQSAQARIPAEEAQRQLQARFNFVTFGNYTLWPACRSGIPAPLYPPDGFYGNLDDDPWFAAYLVQDLCYQFYGYYWPLYYLDQEPFDDFYWQPLYYGNWVKTGLNIEGIYPQDLPVWYYGDEDFPTSGTGFDLANVTPANYQACFGVLRGYLLKLQKYIGNAGIIPVDTVDGLDWAFGGFTSTNSCGEAEREAQDAWDWIYNPYVPGFYQTSVQVYGVYSTNSLGEPSYSVNLSSMRGQAYAGITFIPGTVTLYLVATNCAGCDGPGGTAAPVSQDGRYHSFWTTDVGGGTILGPVLADQLPSGPGCPDINTDPAPTAKGWQITYAFVVFTPDFDTDADSAPLCGDGGGDGGDCGNCQGSGCNVPGTVSATTSSLDVRIALGPDRYGKSAGYLRLHADQPRADLYTPAMLQFAATPDVDVFWDENLTLTQVITPNVAAYIQTNSSGYSILFTNENANPDEFVSSVTISNNANTNQMFITEKIGPSGTPRVIQFLYTAATTNWTKIEGSGLVNESRSAVWTTPTNRTDTIVVSNNNAVVATQTTEKYRQFPWGRTLVERTRGTGSSAATTTRIYDENTNSGGYGQITNLVESSGRWERYQYDFAGRLTNHVAQFKDNATTTADSTNRVTQILYGTNGIITNIVRLLNTEIARSYQIHASPTNGIQQIQTIQCAVTNAAINNSANLTNTVWRTTDTSVTGTAWETIKELHPDGTMTFYTNRTDYPQSGQKTTVVKSGAPNDPQDDIVDGTQTTTIVGQWGEVLTNIVVDIASGLIVDQQDYVYTDTLKRSHTVTHLDGTTETVSYACCGLDSQTDREGVTTTYTYDAAKRQVATTRLNITTTNVLDAASHVLKTLRIGTDSSQITMSAASYGTDGGLLTESNALNGVTTYSRGTNASGQTVLTNTYPDGSVRIETHYQDGSLLSVTGSAVHPVQYLYGVDGDGAFTTEIKVTETGGTNEWVKTCTDLLGRSYKTVYAAASAPYPFRLSTFNSKGQLTNQVDPDGVITLLAYNPKGEQIYWVSDSNRNYTIDFSGTDQITFTTNDVVTDNGTTVRRSRTYVWSAFNSNVSNLISTVETSVDDLRSWRTAFRDASTPVTSETRTVYVGTNRYVTNTAPDGSHTISVSTNGRPRSVIRRDSLNNQVSAISYSHDAHGRRNTITDARDGTTTLTYNNADLAVFVTTPNPGTLGASSQTTVTYFNASGQATNVVNSDGTSVTTEYCLTGEVKRKFGSRTYPVGYSYDYAGRIKTVTNWASFPNTGARVTTLNYDVYRGWLTNRTYDGGAAGPVYSNTPAGRLASRKWARNISTTYGYNNAGALARVVYSDGTTPNVTNTFDRLGRAATSICNGMTTTFSYNDASGLLSESFSGGTLNGLAVTNAYDSYARRIAVALSNQPTTLVQVGYDYAGRLAGVTNGNCSAGYGYLANSPLVSQITFRSNTVTRMTTTKTYDFLNRLTSIRSINSQPSTINSHEYQYNLANQRTRATLSDGSYWLYEYDVLGQARSGKKYWNDGTPVAGQQFEYAFDDIGNRTQAKAGGDENGWNLRSANYAANNLNQYTNRDVPGYADIMGLSFATNSVTVNNQTAYRKGEYFRKELAVGNGSASLWTNIIVAATGQTSVTGNLFVAKSPETFGYDADGNMTNDGRWALSWDAENRLTQAESLSSAPTASKRKVAWEFDCRGRRIRQTTYDGSSGSYVVTEDLKFVSDGKRHFAELNGTNNALIRSYVWGLDSGGSLAAAGGIGGLLMLNSTSSGQLFYAFDGNGNTVALVKASDGSVSAIYEYDPFGKTIRTTGAIGKENPFRFSTKRTSDTVDFVLYEFRPYNPSTGQWLSRDPINESGGFNLYGFGANSMGIDALGLVSLNYIDYPKWAIGDAFAEPFELYEFLWVGHYLALDGSDASQLSGAGGNTFDGTLLVNHRSEALIINCGTKGIMGVRSKDWYFANRFKVDQSGRVIPGRGNTDYTEPFTDGASHLFTQIGNADFPAMYRHYTRTQSPGPTKGHLNSKMELHIIARSAYNIESEPWNRNLQGSATWLIDGHEMGGCNGDECYYGYMGMTPASFTAPTVYSETIQLKFEWDDCCILGGMWDYKCTPQINTAGAQRSRYQNTRFPRHQNLLLRPHS